MPKASAPRLHQKNSYYLNAKTPGTDQEPGAQCSRFFWSRPYAKIRVKDYHIARKLLSRLELSPMYFYSFARNLLILRSFI